MIKKYNTWGGSRAGSGRKSRYGEPVLSVSVSMPRDLVEWLDKESSKAILSRSQLVVDLLAKARKTRK